MDSMDCCQFSVSMQPCCQTVHTMEILLLPKIEVFARWLLGSLTEELYVAQPSNLFVTVGALRSSLRMHSYPCAVYTYSVFVPEHSWCLKIDPLLYAPRLNVFGIGGHENVLHNKS